MLDFVAQLCTALVQRQVVDPNSPSYGAVYCAACRCYHTRAAEAVFPLAFCYRHLGDETWLHAALSLGTWLVKQQEPDGCWLETPSTMPATTVFQLMALAGATALLEHELDQPLAASWRHAVHAAAHWVSQAIQERFNYINYCAASAAALMLAYQLEPEPRWRRRAREFAAMVVQRIGPDGLLWGEGPFYLRGASRIAGRGGVDVGYNLDMALGALALYSQLAGDTAAEQAAVRSLRAHLAFIYPDGSIDNSWGTRSYKWIMAGSQTAHGCQLGLELLAHHDRSFRTASAMNLACLRRITRDGLVGYGPSSWWDPDFVPCLYPTFARATALAMALHGSSPHDPTVDTGSGLDEPTTLHYRSVNVCVVRTPGLKATVTGHKPSFVRLNGFMATMRGMREALARVRPGRFPPVLVQIPAGGCISYLWDQDYGPVQVGTQPDYWAVEPMHMPAAQGLETLTPHVRLRQGDGVFSNLYEDNVSIELLPDGDDWQVVCRGRLKNRSRQSCGVSYRLDYRFAERSVRKSVTLHGVTKAAQVEVVEPIVRSQSLRVCPELDRIVLSHPRGRCIFQLLSDNAQLHHGQEAERYHSPLPALAAYPIRLQVAASDSAPLSIAYQLTMKGPEGPHDDT